MELSNMQFHRMWVCGILAGAAVSALIVGCAHEPPAPLAAKPACLPTMSYTKAQSTAILRAYDALPASSPLIAMVRDYEALRDAARAACGAAQ